jgi:hypothetical protein
MKEQRFQDYLYQLLETVADVGPVDSEDGELLWPAKNESEDIREVRSFQDEGVMTYNKGLVIRLNDGSTFQLTIVRSS